MKKMFAKILAFLTCFAVFITVLVGCQSKKKEIDLLVLAAASLTDVTGELATDYKKSAPQVTLTFSFGSSGTLQTQIEEGAPADLFLSAGKKQMTALSDKGLLLAGTNKELLENKIVLIVPKGSASQIKSFEDLATNKVRLIALGEPTGVPVGQYSEEIFTTLGIFEAVKAKANYASDVRQVLMWVESGEVDCGVVYMTDAMSSDKVTIACSAPDGSYSKVIYPAAVIGSTPHPEEAKAFLEYLSGKSAAKIFEKFGFTVK